VHSFESQNLDIQLWLIDNASSDGTPDTLMRLAKEHKWISVKLNDVNMGLAAANNQPLESLFSPYTAIINPDVVLHPGALRALVAYLENNVDTVAVAPVNVASDGTPHSSFHKGWSLAHLLVWRILPASITQWLYKAFRNYDEQDVLFASGSCIVVRTDDFKRIGGYDPEYFLTVEDVCDLCIRLRRGDRSKRVVVTPTAYITHLRSRSAAVVPFVTLWSGARGSIYHFHKHGGLAAGLAAYAIVFSSSLLRVLVALPGAVFSTRRRASIRNNWQVLRQLVSENPLYIKNRVSVR
jgi:N-acetylglucosaminyl-diphospho-decaprenol L-rhamnosyltransferase